MGAIKGNKLYITTLLNHYYKLYKLIYILGGDCDKADQKTIEFCVFDTINQATAPEGVTKCTEKYYFYHIPKNDKVPALAGKFICLSKNYPT